MNRERRKGLTLALLLMGAQAAAVAGMILTAALMDVTGEQLDGATHPVAAAQQADVDEGDRRDPLRLILF